MRTRFVLHLTLLALLVAPVIPAAAQEGAPPSIIFMHHSTGQGVIEEGNVRAALADLGYAFWDHGYNEEGLTDPAGIWLGENWNVPDDNTDPDGWAAIFQQRVTDPPANTLSHMLQHDVILFKSCFPTSNIDSDSMLQTYRDYYLVIREVIAQHPDKLFIPFTPPPLVPNETTPENAARAQNWAAYLASEDFSRGLPNLFVFDFFSLLADDTGYLRAEYRSDEWDSHPNTLANTTIGPILVTFVNEAVREFMPDRVPTVPFVPADQPASSGPTVEAADPPADDVLLNGFETNHDLMDWWTFQDPATRTLDCALDGPGHAGSAYTLRVTVDLPAETYAGCGLGFSVDEAWPIASGISFVWRSDVPEIQVIFALAVRDPAHPNDPGMATPFEVALASPGSEWTPVTLPWDSFERADWFEGGVARFDPANIMWLAVDVGAWERAQLGTIWIDDVELVPFGG